MLSVGMKKQAFCGFKVIFASSCTSLFAVITYDVSYNIFRCYNFRYLFTTTPLVLRDLKGDHKILFVINIL